MLTEILQKNPSARVAVFAVWFAVLGPDNSSQVDTSLLYDSRVIHFWDSEGEVSAFLTAHADQLGLPEAGLFWDADLLYGPDADWGRSLYSVGRLGSSSRDNDRRVDGTTRRRLGWQMRTQGYGGAEP